MRLKRLVILLFALAGIATPVFAADSSSQQTGDDAFPVIFYGMSDKDQAFSLAKQWGATHLHRYGMGMSIDKDQAFFDQAQKHGLKVMADLRGRYWLKDEHDLKGLREYVNHFKDHPALGFWYLCDEPDNKGYTPAQMKRLYQLVKNQSPKIPVAMAHAWTENWYKYGQAEDILMYDNYPISGDSFPNVRLNSWTNFTKSAFRRGKKDNDAVIPILQMFNWAAMAKEGDKTKRGHPVEDLRYPNTAEMRYMTFTSMALGAPGLSFYSYYRSRMVDPDWGGQVLAPVIKEAKKLAQQTRGTTMHRVRRAEDEDLFVTLWHGDQGTYMILANAWPETRSINRSLGGKLESGTLKPWGKTREVEATLKNGRVRMDQAKPWEVFIWQVKNPH